MRKSKFSKKLAILFMSGMMLGGSVYGAETPIDLQVGNDDPLSGTTDHGKAPIQIPSLWQDGYELTFPSMHSEYALDIVLNGIVVYSTNVSETTTTVILPSWLSGEYELQLYPDDCSYYFYGYVTL